MERKILKMTERGYDGGVVLSLECGHTRNVTHEEMLREMAVIYRAQLSKPSDTHHNVIVCPACEAESKLPIVKPQSMRAGNVTRTEFVYLADEIEAYMRRMLDASRAPMTIQITHSQRRAIMSALKASSRYVDNDHKLVILDQGGAAVLRFDCQEQ